MQPVALGHHLDDLLQTFFLNLIFTGRMETFKPTTYLDRRDLYLIRPLVYLTQKTISSLARQENLPEIKIPALWPGNKGRKSVNWWILLWRYFFFTTGLSLHWKKAVFGPDHPLPAEWRREDKMNIMNIV